MQDPQKRNYLLEGGPLIIQASPTRWVFYEPICISVPAGGVVRGCIQLQWIFLEDSFKAFAHFMMGDLQVYLPIPCWVFSSSGAKTAWPSCPTLPIHLILPWATVLSSQMKKVLKGKHFAEVEEVKQKMAEALKGIKIDEFKNCFKQ